MTLVIDCHGHYTTAPDAHNQWREVQKAAFKAGEAPPAYPSISDDAIRETLEANQIRLLKEREPRIPLVLVMTGTDLYRDLPRSTEARQRP